MNLNKRFIFIIIFFLITFFSFLPNLNKEYYNLSLQHNKYISKKIEYKIIYEIKKNNIKFKYQYNDSKNHNICFYNISDQLHIFNIIKNHKNTNLKYFIKTNNDNYNNYIIKKIKYGLDLVGGIRIKLDIDDNYIIEKLLKKKINKIVKILKQNNIKYYIKKHKEQFKIFLYKEDIFESDIIKKYFNIININNKIYEFKLKNNVKKQYIERKLDIIINILNKRINSLNISESKIYKYSTSNIIVELPGIFNIKKAKNIIGKTANIKFMIIDDNIKYDKNKKYFYDNFNHMHFVQNKIILHGEDIIASYFDFDHIFNRPSVFLKINHTSANKFEYETKKNIGKNLAIIYKENNIEKIINIATIMDKLYNKFQITGLNIKEAKNLSILLKSGNMPSNIKIIEENIISPILGNNSIKNGFSAFIYSFLLISILLCFFYKIKALISIFSMIINIFLITFVISLMDCVLTLPGIAGLILIIGINIDSNILIFERLKEEKYNIDYAFNKVKNGIIDANITTILSSIAIFFISSGPIQGFSIIMIIGIISSFYSSMFVTKTLLYISK